jgi:hypothetical protein
MAQQRSFRVETAGGAELLVDTGGYLRPVYLLRRIPQPWSPFGDRHVCERALGWIDTRLPVPLAEQALAFARQGGVE